MTDINDVLKEREGAYGNFNTQALIAQRLKSIIHESELSPGQREALEMIVVKVSRILNGDPNHIDSWRDIAGYAQLVVNKLEEEARRA